MNTSPNKQFDAIENLIFAEGLRIETLDIHPELAKKTVFCLSNGRQSYKENDM